MKILATNKQTVIDIDLPRIKRSSVKILRILESEDSELSLTFVDNAGIADINRQYLGRNYPTNVIAFSMNEGKFGDVKSRYPRGYYNIHRNGPQRRGGRRSFP